MAAPDRDDDDATPAEEASGEPAEHLTREELEPEDEGDGALPDEHVEEIDELGVETHLDAETAQELADYDSRLAFEEAISGGAGDARDAGDALPRSSLAGTQSSRSIDLCRPEVPCPQSLVVVV